MKAYEPGQSNIDGGGFDIVTFDPKAGYMYVQFESLKNGFIDDLELALVDDDMDKNAVQVRSSSRLGYVSPFFVHSKPSSGQKKSFIFSLFSPLLKVGLRSQCEKNQLSGQESAVKRVGCARGRVRDTQGLRRREWVEIFLRNEIVNILFNEKSYVIYLEDPISHRML